MHLSFHSGSSLRLELTLHQEPESDWHGLLSREKGKASKTPKAKGHVAFIAVLAIKVISDVLGCAVFPATVMLPKRLDSGLAV